MIDQSPSLIELCTSEGLSDSNIELAIADIDRAVQLSQTVPNSLQQWSVYLHTLGLQGVKQWLEEWAPDLVINETQCSLHHPPFANLLDAVSQLQIGQFSVCLIAAGSYLDREVPIPRAVVDLPQFIAHLYVLLEVQQEHLQVRIAGYLRYDQLMAYRQTQELQLAPNWMYSLPLDWITSDPDRMLLDLRYLDRGAISLPTVAPYRLITNKALQHQLKPLLPQLQSPICDLKREMSWEVGAMLLTHPVLADWLYHLQQGASDTQEITAATPEADLSTILQTLTQNVINVGAWLTNQFDTISQDLAWIFLPTPLPATGALRVAPGTLRSASYDLEAILAELQTRTTAVIPANARGAYRNLCWGSVSLRLYVLVWMLPVVNEVSEWVLLLVLGSASTVPMPAGIRLQISDLTQLLSERMTTPGSSDTYLYTQVAGNVGEQFWVTVDMTQGVIVTFTFTFDSF